MTRFRTKMYPSDELASGKRAAAAKPAKVPREVLNAGPAQFENGPPKEWERQFSGPHNMYVAPKYPTDDLVLVEGRYFQRPVPRQASCHYYAPPPAGAATFYFY